MESIREAGTNYGLCFNWGKLEVMPLRCQTQLLRPDGQPITQQDNLVYLGGLLHADGGSGAEL
eukprot:2720330-Pyramimonas_sp.AAC.1